MSGRPKCQRAPEDSQLWSEVVADNVRAHRVLRRMTQDQLAQLMVQLGHRQWSRATVSEVERYGRTVDVDELCGLAGLFGKTVPELLDPSGPGREGKSPSGWASSV